MQQVKFDLSDAPTLREFMASDAFIQAAMGPFGSGKSSACIFKIIKKGLTQQPGPDGIRRTRWAVIRNTYPMLRDTAIRTVHQWFPFPTFGRWRASEHDYMINALVAPGDTHPAQIELLFRALDRPEHVKNLLSMDLTGAWINEAREVPWAIVEAVQGRVDRFPPRIHGGASWAGVLLDTNPPDTDSEFFRFFEEMDHTPAVESLAEHIPGMTLDRYCRLFKQPSGLSEQAENKRYQAPGYWQRLAIGKDPEWVKVYCKGEYGFVIDGRPVFAEYHDAVHCPGANDEKREPITDPRLPIQRGWDFGLCYDDKTEVLTDRGWKLFKDVDAATDRAASRDPTTGRMAFAPIAFKIDQEFDGELIGWAGTEVDMLVTPEHRVPFTYRDTPDVVHFESAEWLAAHSGGHHCVDLLSVWEGDDSCRWFGMPAAAWAAFLGIYTANGSLDRGRVTIYRNEPDARIADILAATGLAWRRCSEGDPKSAGWRLWCPPLAEYLRQLGMRRERRVADEVRRMTPGSIRAFLEAHSIGGGSKRKRHWVSGAEHVAFAGSAALAGDLQELAQRAGWHAAVRHYRSGGGVIADGNCLRQLPASECWVVTYKKRAARAELLEANLRRERYVGRVYCLNVPWHTLYVRRNGRAHWNGNTPACVFSQLSPRGQWRVVDELVATSMGVDRFSDQVLDHSARYFPNSEFEDVGDPAGESRSETDERSCFEVLWAKGIEITGGLQAPSIRTDCVRRPLRTMDADGLPAFNIHPRCRVTRRGLMGGYHYRKVEMAGRARFAEKPEKNAYSHPVEAMCYTATRLFGTALQMREMQMAEDEVEANSRLVQDQTRSRVTGY